MFRDVSECSGMFRNVPGCSMFQVLSTAILKTVLGPWVKILKNYAYTSSENLSTTIRNLYLESLGISKQSLNTLLRFRGFLWIFIGSSLSDYFLSVENIEISLYAQARQSLLVLTQGNIYNRLRFLNKYLMFLEELNDLFRENWSKFLTSGYLVFWKQFPAAGYLDTSKIKIEAMFTNLPK